MLHLPCCAWLMWALKVLGRTPCSPEVLSLTSHAKVRLEVLPPRPARPALPDQTVGVHDCPDCLDLGLQGAQDPS